MELEASNLSTADANMPNRMFFSVSVEIYGHNQSKILLFPSPTGYMLTSLSFFFINLRYNIL